MKREMTNWLFLSFIALILWGVWSFLLKIATNYIDQKSVIIFGVIGNVVTAFIILASTKFHPEVNINGILIAIMSGAITILASLAFLGALKTGKVSVVTVITALYPLLTILLAFVFLKESISLKQGIGILFAVIAVVLFSL